MAAELSHDAKIINFNEARGPDPGFRHRWLDRLQDDPERRQSTFSVAYALARRIDPKKSTPEVWPGIELIAATAQVSISTAKAELKWLHDRGWLAFGKRRPKYVIRVLTMPEIAGPPATVVADPPATITTTRSSPSTKKANSPRAACAAEASEPDLPCALPEESKESGNVGIRIELPRSSNEERCPRLFRQSKVEAAIAWRELERMEGWGGTFGEDELNIWHALLRKGYAANDIVDTAAAFLRKTPWLAPSLGDWLACFESYLDDTVSLPPMHATATEHHHGVAA
jgi:hypothetical protein